MSEKKFEEDYIYDRSIYLARKLRDHFDDGLNYYQSMDIAIKIIQANSLYEAFYPISDDSLSGSLFRIETILEDLLNK